MTPLRMSAAPLHSSSSPCAWPLPRQLHNRSADVPMPVTEACLFATCTSCWLHWLHLRAKLFARRCLTCTCSSLSSLIPAAFLMKSPLLLPQLLTLWSARFAGMLADCPVQRTSYALLPANTSVESNVLLQMLRVCKGMLDKDMLDPDLKTGNVVARWSSTLRKWTCLKIDFGSTCRIDPGGHQTLPDT